jgi:serine phosphatase RsbU (regulator of sigma subunit)/streptogramin lyase
MQDRRGHLWFGTYDGGVSWYDGQTWGTFTTQDGLANDWVWSMVQDGEGHFWFTTNGGISRYDRHVFTVFTRTDGLGHDKVYSIQQDRRGYLWFGTWEGVSRYDGQTFTTFTTFTTADGLGGSWVLSIFLDREGEASPEPTFWFGFSGGGVSQYDGQSFTTFTTQDGLAGNEVHAILQDRAGMLWFGTGGGVSRYDGKQFTTFATQDGLAGDSVHSLLQDRAGMLWFGTSGSGVSRYDGERFTTFSMQDGLGHNEIRCISQDTAGHLWFGTHGGVVSRYDGKVFQTLTRDDGLTGGSVRDIFQDKAGYLWFGTHYGLVRYRQPAPSPPAVEIDRVIANRRYDVGDTLPLTLPTTVGLVFFEFHGRSFKTRPEAMVYRYRLSGYDTDWKNTKNQRVAYQDLPKGTYTFEVLAVDRDLVYSEEPARVALNIVPPFYLQASFLVPTVGGGTILLVAFMVVLIAYLKRRRQVHAYEQLAVAELQDARRVQMGLMPDIAPHIEDLEVAGKCLSANTVSGDFFDYLHATDGREIAIVVGDVTGHGMQGAMNAVMADGILRATAKAQDNLVPGDLLVELNDVLKERMEAGMNVTMVIGHINALAKTLQLANAGHHAHPLLLHNGKVQSLVSKGMPLGMMAGIPYREVEFPLQSGDVIAFMTDGIIEVQGLPRFIGDSEDRYYADSGLLEAAISQFASSLSAEAMVDVILNDAIAFGGEKAQRDDDMTVVVVKVQ